MAFISLKFFVFFAFVLAGWFLLPARGQKLFLLAACWVFYALQSGGLLVLLLLSTLVSYLAALAMERSAIGRRRLWLWLGCLFCFGLLFFYKYFAFFLGPVLRIAHLSLPDWTSSLAVPAGLSFFTFSITGYLFDVYREKLPAERSFVHYALFTSFFPAILAGPVGMARTFLPQLQRRQTFDAERLKAGVLRFVFGVFEKLAVADVIAVAVNAAYSGEQRVSGGMWLLVALGYSLQIYFDFAGYSHMALGAAEALGLTLTENFAAPYYSLSVRSFWKKWHISLTGWFREYLYFPLGGSRKGRARTYLNILIVFTVSGLWHGAARRPAGAQSAAVCPRGFSRGGDVSAHLRDVGALPRRLDHAGGGDRRADPRHSALWLRRADARGARPHAAAAMVARGLPCRVRRRGCTESARADPQAAERNAPAVLCGGVPAHSGDLPARRLRRRVRSAGLRLFQILRRGWV
jgi:D-alanyl-lipoteichoic acid acyltransferase DltB (MBOAT superfamily)